MKICIDIKAEPNSSLCGQCGLLVLATIAYPMSKCHIFGVLQVNTNLISTNAIRHVDCVQAEMRARSFAIS